MSTTCVDNKNFNLSIRMEEIAATQKLSKPPIPLLSKTSIVKEGLVSVLGSDSQRGKSSAASIRRTFSADMSSKQWLAQNGFFSPIKKSASSKDLLDHSSSSEEEDDEIKGQKTSLDVWSSILSQKKDDDDMSNLQTPYIHPLVKRSTSSLSIKSLEICTENLGSETGSDGFSSYSPSENGDVEEDKDEQQQQQYCPQSFEELGVVKYNYSKRSSSFPKSFPPPIPSLARGDNKPSLHMQSRRQAGRLILEAISIPPRNLFHAHRHDGRLLLNFVDNITSTSSSESEMEVYGEEFDEVLDDIDDQTHQFDYKSNDCPEEEEEGEEEQIEHGNIMMEPKLRLSSGVINMKTSALMMKLLDSLIEIRGKSIQFSMGKEFREFFPELDDHLGLGNENFVTWPNKFNEIVNLTGSVGSTGLTEEKSQITSVPQSLPTQLTSAATTSFNAYEYFWRKKPTVTSIVNSPTIAEECNNYTTKQVVLEANSTAPSAKSATKVAAYKQQELVLMKGSKANMNYLVPFHRGCKEPRRSLLIWKPYYIATS
ncbi:protein FAF-like, chloroplastic [Lycium barbarum]|uniref:protein FAF-like, chloroplastic n=1 Tax=Lycium barbarum TaxID=112863 RepID=UPI00293F6A74|nr:protein FAF-like, chloroplastic [Lycium barbarum]